MSFKRIFTACLLSLAGIVGGCATASNPQIDPFEGFNREMFKVNKGIDAAVFKPAASGYAALVPSLVRNCIGGFFGYIDDYFVLANDVLQGKPRAALDATGRIVVNTLPGLLGCFDVASEAGLEKQNEDFGQTLGRWGIGDGPYLVLPLFGSSNFRDAAGLVVYSKLHPLGKVNPVFKRNVLYSVRAVDQRARLLRASELIEQASIDEYAFVRNAYIQRRRYLIYDGNPPPGGLDGRLERIPLAFAAALPLVGDGAYRDAPSYVPTAEGEPNWSDEPNQRAVVFKRAAPVKAN